MAPINVHFEHSSDTHDLTIYDLDLDATVPDRCPDYFAAIDRLLDHPDVVVAIKRAGWVRPDVQRDPAGHDGDELGRLRDEYVDALARWTDSDGTDHAGYGEWTRARHRFVAALDARDAARDRVDG